MRYLGFRKGLVVQEGIVWQQHLAMTTPRKGIHGGKRPVRSGVHVCDKNEAPGCFSDYLLGKQQTPPYPLNEVSVVGCALHVAKGNLPPFQPYLRHSHRRQAGGTEKRSIGEVVVVMVDGVQIAYRRGNYFSDHCENM